MKNVLLKLFLFAVIIVLGYLVYDSVMQPVHFNRERNNRESEVVQRLKDIRNVQTYYKNANGAYTPNFDTLVAFLQEGEIPVVNLIPDPNDTTFTKTISDTLGYIKVSDSLFSKRKSFVVSDLKYIPYSEGTTFEMDAGEIERGGVKVSVFEVKAPFKTYLKGMDNQRIYNLIASREDIEQYAGLKVGSMTEPSTDGNWE